MPPSAFDSIGRRRFLEIAGATVLGSTSSSLYGRASETPAAPPWTGQRTSPFWNRPIP
jgi:hypothetical protein